MFKVPNFASPLAIQDFLDSIPFNFEEHGETCMSPIRVAQERKAHCIEGAIFACAALEKLGCTPRILNLKVRSDDYDHVVALFKVGDCWGAISKTNHNVLRYRDPVYRTIRELALSYFHEYFLVKNGEKTMLGYSRPINLNRFGKDWRTRVDDMWDIAEYIFDAPITSVIPRESKKFIRPASVTERKAADIAEYIANPR